MQLRIHGTWPWILPVIGALLLATPSVTLPGDDLGIRGFVTPSLGPNVTLGQTFVMTANGFRGIEISPVAVEGASSGAVRFELYELYDVGDDHRVTLTRSAEVPVRDLLRAPSFTFSFPPILESRNKLYRLNLAIPATEGIAFWATKGTRYEGGTMEFNGNARWADMVFHTDAPVPSNWALLMRFHEAHPGRASAVMTAFIAIWLLVGFVIRRFEMLPTESAALSRRPSTGSV